MCEFCDNLDYRSYRVMYRTNSADDNTCVFGSPDLDVSDEYDCYGCVGCSRENLHFTLNAWENYISVGYLHRIRRLHIEPFSEAIQINFCPWCGKQLTDKLVNFNKCHLGYGLERIDG